MSIIYILIPIALLLGFCFLLAFIHASNTGQYDDLETPAHRILLDDEVQTVSKDRRLKKNQTHPERKTYVV